MQQFPTKIFNFGQICTDFHRKTSLHFQSPTIPEDPKFSTYRLPQSSAKLSSSKWHQNHLNPFAQSRETTIQTSLPNSIKVPANRPSTDTPKFQMCTRPTKPVPNEALTSPKLNAIHDSTQQRARRLRAPIMFRSALARSLEAPIQRALSSLKLCPTYCPPYDYSTATTSPTLFAYQLLSEPKSNFQPIFYTNTTNNHQRRPPIPIATNTNSDQLLPTKKKK